MWQRKAECHLKGENATFRVLGFAVFLSSILVSENAVTQWNESCSLRDYGLLIESILALTSITYYRGIVMVTTIMNAPPIVLTIDNWRFVALTFYVIQPNLTTSSPKSGMSWSTNSARISKLIANYMCIIYLPPVTTNCSPGVIMKYFNSSFRAPRSSDQSQSWNNFQENVPL